MPGDFPHHGHHHAAHDNQRGGCGRSRDGAHHGRQEERQDEERSGRGKFRQVNWFVYLLTALFILRFLYVAHG